MKKINDGGAAFPNDQATPYTFKCTCGKYVTGSMSHSGMSLRDWFAGMALQGTLASIGNLKHNLEIEKICYQMADAMLKERNNES